MAAAWVIMPVYLEGVSPLENIVEDLKLKRISEEERQAILTRTAGGLSPEEADELKRVIEEGCEKIDQHGW
jgi:hypothetical protein